VPSPQSVRGRALGARPGRRGQRDPRGTVLGTSMMRPRRPGCRIFTAPGRNRAAAGPGRENARETLSATGTFSVAVLADHGRQTALRVRGGPIDIEPALSPGAAPRQRSRLGEGAGRPRTTPGRLKRGPAAAAARAGRHRGHGSRGTNYVGCEHLLLGWVAEPDGAAGQGVPLARARAALNAPRGCRRACRIRDLAGPRAAPTNPRGAPGPPRALSSGSERDGGGGSG